MLDPRPTNADIDEAIRLIRAETGHEPYAPAVWDRALKVAHDRQVDIYHLGIDPPVVDSPAVPKRPE